MSPARDQEIYEHLLSNFHKVSSRLEELLSDARIGLAMNRRQITDSRNELATTLPVFDPTKDEHHLKLNGIWSSVYSYYKDIIASRIQALFDNLPSETKLMIDEKITNRLKGRTISDNARACLRSAHLLSNNDLLVCDDIDRACILFEFCKAVEVEGIQLLRPRLERNQEQIRTSAINLMACEPSLRKNLNKQLHLSKNKNLSPDKIHFVISGLSGDCKLEKVLDGAKAVGLVLSIFGRNYSFSVEDDQIVISNPLCIKLPGELVLRISSQLIDFQCRRNEYIHKLILTLKDETEHSTLNEVSKGAYDLILDLTMLNVKR